MSTIKSSAEHLTLNADGASKDIKFQANGVEKASISSAGAFTSTTIDATKLTGNLPAVNGSALTNLTAANLTGALPAISGANLTGVSSVGGATGVDFNDNVKARFGTGNDLQIYHDGTHGYIAEAVNSNTSGLRFKVAGENGIHINAEGSVDLYYDNNKKLETTDGGVRISNGVGTILDLKSNKTVEQFGSTGNWMKMMWAGGNSAEYFISFRTQNNTQVGYINTNGSSTTYSTSSDYRLKENVDYTWDATTRLKQLKPARFNWIADDTNTLVDGFIAHEVSSIVPEAVSGEKDAMEAAVLYEERDELPEGKVVGDVKFPEQIAAQGIDQSKLVPLLVKTIQELEARITALEA